MLDREFRIEKLKRVVGGTIVKDLDENTKAYNYLRDTSNGLPIYLGKTDEGKPYVMDLTQETSTLITGCSGSGKSRSAYLMALNILAFNDHTDVQVRLLDDKKSRMWQNLGNLPNVQDCTRGTLVELQEVVDVIEERQTLLNELGEYENFKQYKDTGKSGLGYLVVIFDEYESTLNKLKETNKEEFEEVQKLLQQIVNVGRTYGVHLITLGQQFNESLLGRDFVNNSTTRIGFKPVNNTDTVNLFGNENVEPIYAVGVANVSSSANTVVEKVQFATLGTTEETISKLVDSLKKE